MQWNIQGWAERASTLALNKPGTATNMAGIASRIDGADVAVVVLQEICYWQVKWLIARLRDTHGKRYRMAVWRAERGRRDYRDYAYNDPANENRWCRLGIVTLIPAPTSWQLVARDWTRPKPGNRATYATIDLPGTAPTVTVYNAHMDNAGNKTASPGWYDGLATWIKDHPAGASSRKFVLADTNANYYDDQPNEWWGWPLMRRFFAKEKNDPSQYVSDSILFMKDADGHSAGGPRITFPSGGWKIDYVLIPHVWNQPVTSVPSVDATESDHRPVISAITYP